jgi:hypothetical protein
MQHVVVGAAAEARIRGEEHERGIIGTDTGPVYWMLRVACAAEFVGHGAFGIITKAGWLPYFGVVGIPPELAWKLMPVIGTIDITLGLFVGLVRPARAVLLYMAFWAWPPPRSAHSLANRSGSLSSGAQLGHPAHVPVRTWLAAFAR